MGKTCYQPTWHPISDARPPEWRVVQVLEASVGRNRAQTDRGFIVLASRFAMLYANRIEAVKRYQDMTRQWLLWEKECQQDDS